MNRAVLIIVSGILLLLVGAAACANGDPSPTSTPTTPQYVMDKYKRNEAAGEVTYDGKRVRVKGAVHSFGGVNIAYLTPRPPISSGEYNVFYIYMPKAGIAQLEVGREYVWERVVSTRTLFLGRGKELTCETNRRGIPVPPTPTPTPTLTPAPTPLPTSMPTPRQADSTPDPTQPASG